MTAADAGAGLGLDIGETLDRAVRTPSRLVVASEAGPGSIRAGPSIAAFGEQSQIHHKGFADRTLSPRSGSKTR
jgi:hypothetical protein